MDFFEKNIYLKKLDRNITVRMLGQREMAQVLRERDKVTQAMEHKEWFASSDEKDYLRAVKDGFILGAFDGEELAACVFCVLRQGDYAKEMGYPKEKEALCCDYADTFVTPNFRGNGLQHQLEKMMSELCKKEGKKWVLGTVAPKNRYSRENFKKSGHLEVKRCPMYGGLDRIIMEKEL